MPLALSSPLHHTYETWLDMELECDPAILSAWNPAKELKAN